MREQEIFNTRNILRSTGFQSDLARDKSILNFAFMMFMGLVAAFNFIKTNHATVICAILAMFCCLISVFLSLNVLKNNREYFDALLAEETEPKGSLKDLLEQMGDRCVKDAVWAYRFFWCAVILLVLCVILYSDMTIIFAGA